jgi:hypothetical protein
MSTAPKIIPLVLVLSGAVVCFGCAEGKIGVGPFKAASVEVGPGGPEAKGPSAGPFKAGSAEVGPGGPEAKGPSAGPLKTKPKKGTTEDSKER